MEASTPSHRIHFGKFEVEPESGELFKDGRPIRLQGQPIQILLMLLENPGRVVTREELQQRLWPKDTFVDFDHSLNAAIQRLREALSDSADTPRYIETLPRRGYRFIYPIETPQEEVKEESSAGEEEAKRGEGERRKRRRQKTLWVALVAAIMLGIGLTGWLFYSKRSVMPPLKVRKFTSFRGVETNPAFSPDGNQVAFCWNGERQDNWDIYVQLIDGGRPLRLTTNPADDRESAWSPDGRRIAFNRCIGEDCEILITPAIGGAERSLGMRKGGVSGKMSWSRDGKFLAITENDPSENTSRICLVSLETGERRRLTSPPKASWDAVPIFSPDGHTLAFARMFGLQVLSLVDGKANGEPRQLTLEAGLADFDWMPDGRSLVFSSARAGINHWSLWRIAVTGGGPNPLAGVAGETCWFLSVARQGNRLIYADYALDIRIFQIPGAGFERQNALKNECQPFPLSSSTLWEMDPQFSPDGRKIAYCRSPEIWTCDADGANESQVTDIGGFAGSPRWSPDGSHIAFDYGGDGTMGIYVVSAKGGLSKRVTSGSFTAVLPSWSRDGKWIYFWSDRSGRREVYKMPTGGGEAVQITRNGGYCAFESPDGKWLYYAKGPNDSASSIWRTPMDGGAESQVHEGPLSYAYNFVVVDDGIYFTKNTKTGGNLEFIDFNIGKTKTICKVDKGWSYGLTISSDHRWILCPLFEEGLNDLMLVENFH